MVQRMLDLYGRGGNPFEEEAIAPNPGPSAAGNVYRIKKIRITARRYSETDRSVMKERNRKKDYYVSMLTYIQSESKTSDVQQDTDHEEEIEDSMSESSERDSNSESEFADDESSGSGGVGYQIRDGAVVNEEAGQIGCAVPADGSGGHFEIERKPLIKVEPGQIGCAAPADGSGGLFECEIKQEIKVEPELIPYDANEPDDLNQVFIKEEIDLGEGYLENERGLHSSDDCVREPSLVRSIKEEVQSSVSFLSVDEMAADRGLNSASESSKSSSEIYYTGNEDENPDGNNMSENEEEAATAITCEAEEITNDGTLIKEEIDLGVDEIPAGRGLNSCAENSIAASLGPIADISCTTNEQVADRSHANRERNASDNKEDIKVEAAAGDESGTEVPMIEDPVDKHEEAAAPTRLKSESGTPPENVQAAPQAPPIHAAVDWIPLHEIPVVSRHVGGTQIRGTLLIPQGSGGGRQWNKICDAEGRELSLSQFLQYKKRTWLAVEAPGDGQNWSRLCDIEKEEHCVCSFIQQKKRKWVADEGADAAGPSQCNPKKARHSRGETHGGADSANGSSPFCRKCGKTLPELEETQPENQKSEN